MSIDLKNPDGLAAFLKLAATADVLVENMRMQVKHRLKIAYDDLKDDQPAAGLRLASPASARPAPIPSAAASTRSPRAWAG